MDEEEKDILEKWMQLQADILHYHMQLEGEAKEHFAKQFGITAVREGRIENHGTQEK